VDVTMMLTTIRLPAASSSSRDQLVCDTNVVLRTTWCSFLSAPSLHLVVVPSCSAAK
jgi:hypothetical protein